MNAMNLYKNYEKKFEEQNIHSKWEKKKYNKPNIW